MIEIIKEAMANMDVVSIIAGALMAVLGMLGGKAIGLIKKSETKIDDKLAVAVVEKLVTEGLVKEKVLTDLKKNLGTEDAAGV